MHEDDDDYRPRKSMGERLAVIESDIRRIQSDITSEKNNRKGHKSETDEELRGIKKRLDSLEKKVYLFLGAIAMLQGIMTYYTIYPKKG